MSVIYALKCDRCGYIDEDISSPASLGHAKDRAIEAGWVIRRSERVERVHYCCECSVALAEEAAFAELGVTDHRLDVPPPPHDVRSRGYDSVMLANSLGGY